MIHCGASPARCVGSRRPLRAGYELFVDNVQVGCVTSGTSVAIEKEGSRAGASRTEELQYEMRPVGLALVRSDIRYRADAPVRFTVRDARQTLMEAHLVERNLPPPAAPAA